MRCREELLKTAFTWGNEVSDPWLIICVFNLPTKYWQIITLFAKFSDLCVRALLCWFGHQISSSIFVLLSSGCFTQILALFRDHSPDLHEYGYCLSLSFLALISLSSFYISLSSPPRIVCSPTMSECVIASTWHKSPISEFPRIVVDPFANVYF